MKSLLRRSRLTLESLHDRIVPAVLFSLSGTEATFLADAEDGFINLSVNPDGYVQHNISDSLLNSFIDLDSSTPGDQTLLASSASAFNVDLSASAGTVWLNNVFPPLVNFSGGQFTLYTGAIASDTNTTFNTHGFTFATSEVSISVNFGSVQGIVFNLGDGNDTIDARPFTQIGISAFTRQGNDVLYGTSFDDVLIGGDGSDYLQGGAGNDYLSGDDSYSEGWNDTLIGGDGDDYLTGGLGQDVYRAGAGIDTIEEYLSFNGTFIARLNTLNVDGFVQNNYQAEVFTIIGSEGDDLVDCRPFSYGCAAYGGGGNDKIYGTSGDDFLDGGDGIDLLDGREGNDQLNGGPGDNTLLGGAGDDLIFGGNGNDDINGQSGADNIYGFDGNDVLRGGLGNDWIRGGSGNDEVYGNSGNDDLNGEEDSDIVHGGTDDDILNEFAESGITVDDQLYGDAGDDFVYSAGDNSLVSGGSGNDHLFGGNGCSVQGGAGNDSLTVTLEAVWNGGNGNDTLSFTQYFTQARITNSGIVLDGVTYLRNACENFILNAENACIFDASGYTAGYVNFSGSAYNDILR
ncbi:MAG TPA: calcium-binding protein, partial [Gemmatales bacterium]|nr:calcium-binding protein [Gemmatales bacterium]